MSSNFTPHQEARIRGIFAEMLAVMLRGADERVRRAIVEDALSRDGIVVVSSNVHVEDNADARR